MQLDPKSTSLVLIDLQRGVLARTTAPHAAAEVYRRSMLLAQRFRDAGALVVRVRVSFSADLADALRPPVDEPTHYAALPAGWDEFPEPLPPQDLVITKHQWGAFYGTELELQLRRRGITTLLMCGISTNFGVESTARDGWERGFRIVFVEDAMAGMSAEAHAFAIATIFPRIGRVRSSADVLAALGV